MQIPVKTMREKQAPLAHLNNNFHQLFILQLIIEHDKIATLITLTTITAHRIPNPFCTNCSVKGSVDKVAFISSRLFNCPCCINCEISSNRNSSVP